MKCQIANMTLDTFSRINAEDDGASLPATLGPLSGHTWWVFGTKGHAQYVSLGGSIDVWWSFFLGPLVTPAGNYKADVAMPSEGEWQCTVQFAPPPQPVVMQPTPVVPAPNNTGPTNVLAVPVEVEQRKRIAKSAKDEWDRWKVISAEGDRLTLRQQYFDTIPEPGRTEILKAVTSHNNSKTHWCGIFGAWNVRQVRNDGVGWSLAGRPTKVLLCYDVAKLHTGDIGIVADDPAVVKAWGDWKKLYDAQYAALKAANPTWAADKLDQETRKVVPPAPKMPVNHHVLVTDASKDPVDVVQGNTGAAQGTPYASYSIVLDGTVERRKLGGFYCSVPDKTCMDKAVKTNNWQCPIRNGQPCVLPDK